jgi:CelD/BcsL family acetyltransferase involved in cellulose biosynthesis
MILPAAPKRANVRLSFRLGDITLALASRPLACHSFDPTVSPVGMSEVLNLPSLPGTDGWLIEGLPLGPGDDSRLTSRPWLVYRKATYDRQLADLSAGYEAYLAKFSSKTRSTLRRKLRKFAEASHGEIRWRCYNRPEDMSEFYRLGRDISAKTYQERLLNAGLPEDETFFTELMRRAEAGSARGYILFLCDVPVSYLYLPIEGERAIYAYLGYDPKVAGLSPGTVLHLLAIEDLCDNNVASIFDFTQGGGQHKEMFSTYSVPCVDLLLLQPSFSNRLLISSHKAWGTIESRLGRLLDFVGFKKLIRAYLRGQR